MKVAVAGRDEKRVSKHFGRSKCWLVFELDGGEIASREVRKNTHKSHRHNHDEHHEDHHGEHHDHQHEEPHDHADIVEALKDCEAVVSAGMCWDAAREMRQNGIEPYLLDQACDPEKAVSLYVGGALSPAQESICRSHQDKTKKK